MTSRRISKSLFVILWYVLYSSVVLAAKPDYVYFSVNGDTTKSTLAQADVFLYGCNCDSGATVSMKTWFDVDSNGVVEPAIDALIDVENLTDGNPLTDEIPERDGWVYQGGEKFAYAPGHYVFEVEDIETQVSTQRSLNIQPMLSPPSQFSGHLVLPGVTPPNGILANRLIGAVPYYSATGIYTAMTNDSGIYTMNVDAGEIGLEFLILAFGIPGFVAPREAIMTATAGSTEKNFIYDLATDSVYGYVTDESLQALGFEGTVSAYNADYSNFKYTLTTAGRYVLYFDNSDQGEWSMNIAHDTYSPLFFGGNPYVFDRGSASFRHDFALHKADASIYAVVTEDYGLPVHRYMLIAWSDMLASNRAALTGTGSDNIAVFPVSSLDASGWRITFAFWDERFPILPQYVQIDSASNISPGDTVYLNLSTHPPCCVGMRGNANGDPDDKVNVTDITYLVQYLFGVPNGPAPPCPEEANTNGDPEEKNNITDITYLVKYLFGVPSGPAPPVCP